jgi:hypothetical protein
MPKSTTITLVAINAVLATALTWTSAQSQTPPPVHDVLRARLIELVNDNGDVVGQFYPGEGGGGQIRLRNADGEVRVKLGAANDGRGAGLVLMDARTEPVVVLASAASGSRLELDGRSVGR